MCRVVLPWSTAFSMRLVSTCSISSGSIGTSRNSSGRCTSTGISVPHRRVNSVSYTHLTTAIGIGSTGASVINEVSKGRISYKLWMGIACVVGAVFGSFGIQNIINYVTPIFLIMYPICIVLTVLGLSLIHIRGV